MTHVIRRAVTHPTRQSPFAASEFDPTGRARTATTPAPNGSAPPRTAQNPPTRRFRPPARSSRTGASTAHTHPGAPADPPEVGEKHPHSGKTNFAETCAPWEARAPTRSTGTARLETLRPTATSSPTASRTQRRPAHGRGGEPHAGARSRRRKPPTAPQNSGMRPENGRLVGERDGTRSRRRSRIDHRTADAPGPRTSRRKQRAPVFTSSVNTGARLGWARRELNPHVLSDTRT